MPFLDCARRAPLLFALGVLMACGSTNDADGGGGDRLTLQGGLREQYIESPQELALNGADPDLFAQEEASIDGLEVGLWSSWTGSGSADGFEEYLFVNFKRRAEPGEYALDGDELSALYRTDDVLYFGSASVEGAAGTAQLTEVGEVGERVSGTFELTLCQSPNASDFPSDCMLGSRIFRGSFAVTREARGSGGRGRD